MLIKKDFSRKTLYRKRFKPNHFTFYRLEQRHRKKSSDGQERVTFAEEAAVSNGCSDEMIALDGVLNRPTESDKRKTQVVEMKFFCGLRIEEIAGVLKI